MNLIELCEKKYKEIHQITVTRHVDPDWFHKAHGLSVVFPNDVINLMKLDVDILDTTFPDRHTPVYVANSVITKTGVVKRGIFLFHTIRDFKQESVFIGKLDDTNFVLFALSNETYSMPATHYRAEWSVSIRDTDITQAVKNCFEYLVSIPCTNNQFPRPNSNTYQPETKPAKQKYGSIRVIPVKNLFKSVDTVTVDYNNPELAVLYAFIETVNTHIRGDVVAPIYWEKSHELGIFLGFGTTQCIEGTSNVLCAYFLSGYKEGKYIIRNKSINISRGEWTIDRRSEKSQQLHRRFDKLPNPDFVVVDMELIPKCIADLLNEEIESKLITRYLGK